MKKLNISLNKIKEFAGQKRLFKQVKRQLILKFLSCVEIISTYQEYFKR